MAVAEQRTRGGLTLAESACVTTTCSFAGSRRLALVVVAAFLAGASAANDARPTMAADHNDPIHVQAHYRSGDISGYAVDTGDPAADIADLFAWYNAGEGGEKNVVLALTWRADPLEEKEKSFDPTVQYALHIATGVHSPISVDLSNPLAPKFDSSTTTEAKFDIAFWFGPGKGKLAGTWGMRVDGLPGALAPLIVPVGSTVTTSNGVKVAAGLFDDAFFADLDGFFNAVYVALGNQKPAANPSLPPERYTLLDPNNGIGGSLLERPFGYPKIPLDGFGHQNVHAAVVEIPASLLGDTKIHVWGTTERVPAAKRSGEILDCAAARASGIDTYRCKKGSGQ